MAVIRARWVTLDELLFFGEKIDESWMNWAEWGQWFNTVCGSNDQKPVTSAASMWKMASKITPDDLKVKQVFPPTCIIGNFHVYQTWALFTTPQGRLVQRGTPHSHGPRVGVPRFCEWPTRAILDLGTKLFSRILLVDTSYPL